MNLKSAISMTLLCVSLLLLASYSVLAQLTDKEKKEKQLENEQQLERKAYVLAEEIANGALSLKLPENRLYVMGAAAELLWYHDEPRARNLFWDALNTLTLMAPPAVNTENEKNSKPSAKDKEREQGQYFLIFALRQDLIRRVARHDAQLALDMLRSSRQPPLEPTSSSFYVPDDRDLEQEIAAEAATRDPKRALQLARDSLAKGLSFQLLNLLFRLNQRDGELGTTFAGEIVEKLRGRNLTTDQYGGRIAVSLVNFSRTPAAAPERTPPGGEWRHLKLAEEQRRELVEMITNAALSGPTNGNLLLDTNEIMPEIEQFTPERVTELKRKLAVLTQTLNKEQKISQEYNSLFRNGTPEEMLKLANRTTDYDRQWMGQQAVVMAVMRGRADSLRELINTEVEDEGRRKSLIDTLDAEQIDTAVNKGNAEELRKLLPQVRRKEERARAMVAIAVVMKKNGSHDEALKLLDEAGTMIKTDLSSETQTNALLALMAAYALVEPAKAFGIVERIIDRANDDLAKLLLLDKIVSSGAVKKGEIKLQNSVVMPVDFAVFKYGKAVAALANADFDRTKAAADRFQRNELRLMARLMLAQALLRGNDQGSEKR